MGDVFSATDRDGDVIRLAQSPAGEYVLSVVHEDGDGDQTTNSVWVTREVLLEMAAKIPPAYVPGSLEEVEAWLET